MDTLKKYCVSITGVTPYIMHSDLACNPMSPLTKKIKEISSIKKKKDEHYLAMARLEWEAGLYYNEDIGIYLPSKCILGSIKAAAKKFRLGKDTKAITSADILGTSIDGMQKINPEKLWGITSKSGDQTHVYCVSVVIQRSRIMRTRPIFPVWSTSFHVYLDSEILSYAQFERIVQTAGFEYGVGELRPGLGCGSHGKFTIDKIEELPCA